ncbi:EamA family transporter [Vibrio aquimaris]|uniref:Putative DMT superfamily transporter inner membrane protein n=2 Tax=Vibrio aquimaris TaxID=2587862 RepID=A0A5P9CPK0_9VIBR|nr:putative DMT superfamily transporter inner membrane protein [Vibrio aquimaris]
MVMTLMVHQKQRKIGIGLILFSSLLWGTTGTAASLIPNVSPLAIGGFSMGLGGFLLALLARKTIISDRMILNENKWLVCIGALALAVYPLAFYTSMKMAGVAIGTVVSISSAPLFVAIIERLFSKNTTVDLLWIFSLFIGTLGISLLVFSDSSVAMESSEINHHIGISLGLLAGLTYAIYAWVARDLITKGANSKSAMGSVFGLGAVFLIPSLIFTGDGLFDTQLSTSVALYMALVPMFLGYVCFGYGLKVVSASQASLLTLFEPVVATVFALSIVGERIEALGLIGIGLIMMCLLLQSYQPKSKSHLALQSE